MRDHDLTDPDDEPGTIKEIVVTIAAALLLAYGVQAFMVKPFRIPSGSMENTLHCGDRVLVDRVSYRFGEPGRFDVVVFNPPAAVDEQGTADPATIAGEGGSPGRQPNGKRVLAKADVNYIKRIVGMPGDTVEVKAHRALIAEGGRGKPTPVSEPYLHPLPEGGGITSESEYGPVTVPKGTYLMLGDHRDNSADGRVFGFVPRDFIVGKAFMVYWPPKRLGGLPDADAGGPKAARPDPNCIESIPEQPLPEQGDG